MLDWLCKIGLHKWRDVLGERHWMGREVICVICERCCKIEEIESVGGFDGTDNA